MFHPSKTREQSSMPDQDLTHSLPKNALSELLDAFVPPAQHEQIRAIDSTLEERVITYVGNRFGNHVPLRNLAVQNTEGSFVWGPDARTEMKTAIQTSQIELGEKLRSVRIQPGSPTARALDGYFIGRYQNPKLAGSLWRTGTLRTMETLVTSNRPIQKDEVLSVMAVPLLPQDAIDVSKEWLRKTNQAVAQRKPDDVVERYASLYGHLGTINSDPEVAKAISEFKFMQLVRLQEYVEKNPNRGLTPQQVELIGMLAWKDQPSLRAIRKDLERGKQLRIENPLAGYEGSDLRRLGGATLIGVTIIGTGLAAGAPAAAIAPATANSPTNLANLTQIVTPSVSLIKQNKLRVPGSATAITVVTTTEAVAPSQAAVIQNATVQAANMLNVISDLQAPMPNVEPQTENVEASTRQKIIADPEASDADRRLELVRQLGKLAPVVAETTTDPEAVSEAPAKTLEETNKLLAEKISENVEELESRINARGISDEKTLISTHSSMQVIRSLLDNPNSISMLSKEEKNKILTAEGTDFGPIIKSRAGEIAKSLGTEELGKWKGLDKQAQDLLTHAYAIVELASLPKSTIKDLIQATIPEYDNETPNPVGFGPENEPKKPSDKPINKKEVNDKALDVLKDSSDKLLAKQARYVEELMKRGMKEHIAIGFVANMTREVEGYGLDCSTEQVNGPAIGCIQWEGPRKQALLAYANAKGKVWSDAGLQFDFILHELNGEESEAWEKIKRAKNAEDAATAILEFYERAADKLPGGANDHKSRGFATDIRKAISFTEKKIQERLQQKTSDKPANKEAKGEKEIRERIVKIAEGEIGVRETPNRCDQGNPSKKGSCGPDIDKFTEGTLEYWCADFATWVHKTAGAPFVGNEEDGWRIPSVGTIKEKGEKRNTYHSQESDYKPQVGDFIIFGNGRDNTKHIGVVTGYKNGEVEWVGGNQKAKGSSNGNAVTRQDGSAKGYDWIMGYVEPNFK